MVLTTAYFPPIEFFATLARNSVVYMEACESYQKQSYRNRCRILSAGGVLDLNFPVVHGESRLITEIRVDYSTPWVTKTKKAISTAYDNSPFFEYYRDQLFAILDSKPETLWELNMRLIEFFMKKIGLGTEILSTSELSTPALDIHPKRESSFRCPEYQQVFAQKFGFVNNLSIMDLLFNEGPGSICYLK